MDSVEEARAHLQQGVDSLNERIAKAREANARIQALRTAVTSEDESVRVEVDASGRLMSIEFGRSAGAISLEELSRSVMAAYAEAQRANAVKVGEVAGEAWGENSQTAQEIRKQAEDHVVDLPEDDDPDQPKSARWGVR